MYHKIITDKRKRHQYYSQTMVHVKSDEGG